MNAQYLLNETTDISVLYNHLNYLLEATEASVYWKDVQGYYLGANTPFLQHASLSSVTDIMKKTDLDLIWSNEAVKWRKNDHEVMTIGKAKKYLEPYRIENRVELFLSHKMPLRSRNGEIIGIFGISRLCSEMQAKSISHFLSEDGLEALVSLNIKKYQKNSYLTSDLTKRQMDCLRYIVKGMTAKEIAKIMYLSPRTIEHYVQAIKLKWNCHSRSKLVEKAFEFFKEKEH